MLTKSPALEKIENFLRGDKEVFMLKGYASTGKTFLIREILAMVGWKSAVIFFWEIFGYKTPDKLQREPAEILYSDLAEYIGIVENIKREKNWVFVRFSAENTTRYVGEKANELNAGDIVKIKVKENNVNGEKKYDAPTIMLSEDQEPNLDFAIKVKDVIEIDSKGHGHLQNYFIPQSILKRNNIEDGDEISAIFIKERNGKSKCVVINKE